MSNGNENIITFKFSAFPSQTLDNIMIAGVSGSGKTTLANAIASSSLNKNVIGFFKAGKEYAPAIKMVTQHYHFKNLSNTGGSFYYQQRFNSFDADDAATIEQELAAVTSIPAQIDELLTQFNMLHRKHSSLLHLSSGEHKRFQLIKALLEQPEVLVLDEPFMGLDVSSRKTLQHIINTQAAKGTRFIIICDKQDAPKCISNIAIMHEKQLQEVVSIESYLQNPGNTIHNTQRLKPVPAQLVHSHFSTIVAMKNVNIAYGEKVILKNINWQVNAGDKWLVKGANGAGKSTLLSLITADNPQAYANEIYLFDKRRGSGESIWDIKKNIGYVSPELQWYFDTGTTCYQAIASGFFDTIGLFRNVSEQQDHSINEWLSYFKLEAFKHKLLNTLSVSLQRQVLLIRAIIKNPPLLILDEPCQGLDKQQKEDFVKLVDALCNQTNRTLIYVSHYEAEIPNCIDHILELQNGETRIVDNKQIKHKLHEVKN